MKISHLALASALALAGGLAACNENPAQSEPVNAAQDAMSEPVGQTSAAILGANTVEGYVTNAAIGDMYEIQAAEIALERTQNAQVRELAQMIRNDHTAASQRLRGLAASAGEGGVELPTEMDERRQGLIDNLRAASAADFDAVFIDQQVAAHREALTLHRGFADHDDARQLADHARQVVPNLERHLQMAEQLDD